MTHNSTSIVCTFCFCGCEVVLIVEQLKGFDGSTFNQLCVFAFVLSSCKRGGNTSNVSLLLYLMQSLHFILGIFDQLDVFAKLVRAVNN